MDIATSLALAIKALKTLKETTDALEDAHIKIQIAELMSALADAKIEAANSLERIAQLENEIAIKKAMTFSNGKYYQISSDGVKEGPFCATCFDSDKKEIRLQRSYGSPFGNYSCRVCKGFF